MDKYETLFTYAKIFEKPRRYVKGGPLHPPGEIEKAAAKALRFYAKCLLLSEMGGDFTIIEMEGSRNDKQIRGTVEAATEPAPASDAVRPQTLGGEGEREEP